MDCSRTVLYHDSKRSTLIDEMSGYSDEVGWALEAIETTRDPDDGLSAIPIYLKSYKDVSTNPHCFHVSCVDPDDPIVGIDEPYGVYFMVNWTSPLPEEKFEILTTYARWKSSVYDPLHQKFANLAAEWRVCRGVISSADDMVAHTSYIRIVDMGKAAIQYILDELVIEPDHWFTALNEITGEDPIPEEARGNMAAMADAWVRWGEYNGYR